MTQRPWNQLAPDMQARVTALISPFEVERFGTYHARQAAQSRLDREIQARTARIMRGLPA